MIFSDVVMAIAITLLVIDIRPPESGDAGYAEALLAMLRHPEPSIAVGIGFHVLGSSWMSHRAVFALMIRSSPSALRANLVVLFGIAKLQPFFTLAVAEPTPNRVSVSAEPHARSSRGSRCGRSGSSSCASRSCSLPP